MVSQLERRVRILAGMVYEVKVILLKCFDTNLFVYKLQT